MEREKKTKVKISQFAKRYKFVQVKRSETTDPVICSKTPVNSELQLVKMLRGGAGELSKKNMENAVRLAFRCARFCIQH